MEKIYKASYVVSHAAHKYMVNSYWVWDILEEQYGIIKGTNGAVLASEKKEVEEYIASEIEAGRA